MSKKMLLNHNDKLKHRNYSKNQLYFKLLIINLKKETLGFCLQIHSDANKIIRNQLMKAFR